MIERLEVTTDHLRYLKEQTAVGDYFSFDTQRQEVVIHDVVTKEPINGDEMPPGILLDPDMRLGLNFLHQQGKTGNLTILLMLARHGRASHFTDLSSKYPHALEQASVMALEMSGSQEDDGKTFHAIPRIASAGGIRAFQEAELTWAKEHNKLVLPCELADNNRSALKDNSDYLLNKIHKPLQHDDTVPPEIRNAGVIIAETAYQRTRQPALLAHVGYMLYRYCKQGDLPTDGLCISIVLGSWHKYSQQRLRAMDVPVKTYSVEADYPDAWPNKNQTAVYGQTFMRLTSLGRIPFRELGIVRPYTF